MNKKYVFEIEYIITRASSISLIYGTKRTSIDYQKIVYLDTNYTFGGFDTPTNPFYFYNPYDLSFKVKSTDFGLKYTKYWRKYGGISPLGWYHAGYVLYSKNVIEFHRNLKYSSQKMELQEFPTLSVGFEIGRQKIYFDCLALSYGVVFQRVLNYNFLRKSDEDYNGVYEDESSLLNENERLKKNAIRCVAYHEFFNIKLGVAYIF